MDTIAKNYEVIWGKVIEPSLKEIAQHSDNFKIKDNAKELILEEYKRFNNHCKQTYMKNPSNKLDRHKVSACYILAIVKASPIITDSNNLLSDDEFYTVNEEIALTVGLSILRAFCRNDKRYPVSLPFDFTYPEASHGDYRKNFVVELHFTKEEGNYNILSLSHTLYLLEQFNQQYWKT